MLELIVQHLRAIGLGATESSRGDTYRNVLVETDKFDALAWQVNRSLEHALLAQATTSNKFLPGGNDPLTYAVAWRQWFESDGAAGVERPPAAKELQDLFQEWQCHDFGSSKYTSDRDAHLRHRGRAAVAHRHGWSGPEPGDRRRRPRERVPQVGLSWRRQTVVGRSAVVLAPTPRRAVVLQRPVAQSATF